MFQIGWQKRLLIRAALPIGPLAILLAIYWKYPYVAPERLLFLAAVSVMCVFLPDLPKLAIGAAPMFHAIPQKRLLMRAALAMAALATLLAIHWKYPYVERESLLFLAAVSVMSVFLPDLGNMAMGAFVIVAATIAAALLSGAVASAGVRLEISRFDILGMSITAGLIGLSAGLLRIYTDYRAWHLLGALGIVGVFLVLLFHGKSSQVQGAGWLFGVLAAVSWLLGIAAGGVTRFHRCPKQPNRKGLDGESL
jgi:hypothetical protein